MSLYKYKKKIHLKQHSNECLFSCTTINYNKKKNISTKTYLISFSFL